MGNEIVPKKIVFLPEIPDFDTMNRIRHNFKVKGKNVKGWKEQAATIDPSTKIENKNEKQMRKKNK